MWLSDPNAQNTLLRRLRAALFYDIILLFEVHGKVVFCWDHERDLNSWGANTGRYAAEQIGEAMK
jgi:hypothetical protein